MRNCDLFRICTSVKTFNMAAFGKRPRNYVHALKKGFAATYMMYILLIENFHSFSDVSVFKFPDVVMKKLEHVATC